MQSIWLILGLIAIAAPIAAAGPTDEGLAALNIDHPAWPAAKLRMERIRTELTAPDFGKQEAPGWAKDWAGVYCTNGGPGKVIAIAVAPKSGVAYACSGCVSVYDANEGDIVAVAPDSLSVRWASDPKKSEQRYLSAKLFFVRWGQRQYLVPEVKMLTFIAHYNRGGKARGNVWDMPLRRDIDPKNDLPAEPTLPPGRPQLPANLARYIVDRPTRLTIRAAKVTDRQYVADVKTLSKIQGEVELAAQPDAKIFLGAEIDWVGDQFVGSIKIDTVENTKLSGKFTGMFYSAEARLPGPGSEIILPGAAPDPQ
jgi:hypothetical protein